MLTIAGCCIKKRADVLSSDNYGKFGKESDINCLDTCYKSSNGNCML